MVIETLIPALSTLLGGGLVLGLLRLRPEKQNLLATASERAVSTLIISMDELEERLEQAQKREARLLKEMAVLRAEIVDLRATLADHKNSLVTLQIERDAWKQRALDSGWRDKS